VDQKIMASGGDIGVAEKRGAYNMASAAARKHGVA